MATLAQYTFELANVTLSGLNVTGVADQTSNAYDLVGISNPLYEPISWNGLPAITTDGSASFLKNTTGLANAMAGGSDTPSVAYVVCQKTGQPQSPGTLIACADNASANPFYRFFWADLPAAVAANMSLTKRDAATGAGGGTGPVSNPMDFNLHIWKLKNDGTTGSIYRDGVLLVSASVAVGTMGVLDNFALGCLSRTTDAGFFAGRYWACSVHDTLTANEEAAIDSIYDSVYRGARIPAGGRFERRPF